MTMCERVDSILQARGMSRRKLAIEAHIPPSSFQSAMARNGDLPVDMLFRVSDVLNVSVYFLARGEDSPNIPYTGKNLDMFNTILAAREVDIFDDFLEKLGYETFIDVNRLSDEEKREAGDVWVINSIKDSKFYYATTQDLNQLANTILSFSNFQIHELLQRLHLADKQDIGYYQIMNKERSRTPQAPQHKKRDTTPEE